jgi:DNA-binding response OmpR family regulator
VILSRLRRKLGDPPLIHTVTGVGYRLDPGVVIGPAS